VCCDGNEEKGELSTNNGERKVEIKLYLRIAGSGILQGLKWVMPRAVQGYDHLQGVPKTS
jgi:hypothetical protein